MDEVDRLILRALQEDGRTSFTDIARRAGVSETTIRAHYRNLSEQGIVRTVGVVDPHALGFSAPAILGVVVAPGEGDGVAGAIAALPEVSYVVLTLGQFDLIVEVFCRDLPHLTEFVTGTVQLLPGVVRTETLMIARSYKLAYRWALTPTARRTGGSSKGVAP
ncbi:MAG: Lrp/AsnC family transcriptional regulator [Actinobacteria bacterium]|nr:Lrp/AsnC family transcriptional regulator [Actinomycetota bacterium]